MAYAGWLAAAVTNTGVVLAIRVGTHKKKQK
jgi:hypothetical protein